MNEVLNEIVIHNVNIITPTASVKSYGYCEEKYVYDIMNIRLAKLSVLHTQNFYSNLNFRNKTVIIYYACAFKQNSSIQMYISSL